MENQNENQSQNKNDKASSGAPEPATVDTSNVLSNVEGKIVFNTRETIAAPAPTPISPMTIPVEQNATGQSNPRKKMNKWVIAAIIAGVLLLIILAIIGIMTFFVQGSLKNARVNAQDAYIKSSLMSAVPQAILYADSNNDSYKGFIPDATFSPEIQKCAGNPIVNISPDGKDIAIFAKLCSETGKYFCVDPQDSKEVDERYAKSGANTCFPKEETSASGNSFNANTEERENLSDEKEANPEDSLAMDIVSISNGLEEYFEEKNTYKGYALPNATQSMAGSEQCQSIIKLDVSPDGTKYVVHRPLCSDLTKSICVENGLEDMLIVDTLIVEKTYHCR